MSTDTPNVLLLHGAEEINQLDSLGLLKFDGKTAVWDADRGHLNRRDGHEIVRDCKIDEVGIAVGLGIKFHIVQPAAYYVRDGLYGRMEPDPFRCGTRFPFGICQQRSSGGNIFARLQPSQFYLLRVFLRHGKLEFQKLGVFIKRFLNEIGDIETLSPAAFGRLRAAWFNVHLAKFLEQLHGENGIFGDDSVPQVEQTPPTPQAKNHTTDEGIFSSRSRERFCSDPAAG
ncbi:hypothetical protein B0H19DRAFT_1117179 [Mycena capillaripes]|nr:hypothetical protein B0H19DRAFT_1117179 [Mycena capillaripes]